MNSQDRVLRGAAAAAVAQFVGATVALAAPGAVSPSRSTGGAASTLGHSIETPEPTKTAEPAQDGHNSGGDQSGDNGDGQGGSGSGGDQGGHGGQGNG